MQLGHDALEPRAEKDASFVVFGRAYRSGSCAGDIADRLCEMAPGEQRAAARLNGKPQTCLLSSGCLSSICSVGRLLSTFTAIKPDCRLMSCSMPVCATSASIAAARVLRPSNRAVRCESQWSGYASAVLPASARETYGKSVHSADPLSNQLLQMAPLLRKASAWNA